MRYILIVALLLTIGGCGTQSVDNTPSVDNTQTEVKTDEETWGNTGRTVKIKGCEDWKVRNPEADC